MDAASNQLGMVLGGSLRVLHPLDPELQGQPPAWQPAYSVQGRQKSIHRRPQSSQIEAHYHSHLTWCNMLSY